MVKLNRRAILAREGDGSYTLTSSWEVDGEPIKVTASTMKEARARFEAVAAEMNINSKSFNITVKLGGQESS